MGCWFACLRFRAQKRSPPSSVETTPCKSRDRLMPRKRLASVFAPEEKGSPCEGDGVQGGVDVELKRGARFLKSCGALLETPAEFTKASQKTSIQKTNQDDICYNSHFSLRDSSCKKLQWDEQLDDAPCSPASHPKGLLDNTYDIPPSSKQQVVKTYSNIVHSGTPVSLSISAQIRARSVRFEVVQDGSGVESVDVGSKAAPHDGSHIHSLSSTYSPCPTPLKLTDEMETPGTVYPAKAQNFGFGNNARIRSQYIYPVLNPMMNRSQRKTTSEVSHHLGDSGEVSVQLVQDADSDGGPKLHSSLDSVSVNSASHQSDEHLYSKDSIASREPASIDSTRLNVGSKPTISCLDDGQFGDREQAEMSSGSSTLVVSSLSPWPVSTDQHEERVKPEAAANRRSPVSGSPERDRPIIGSVAAHWNSEEFTRVLSKLWDGNGIPNSTNKYKEDQRVSWHATPFEERLEKALSEEKLCPHWKLVNGKPELDEGDEERDIATS